MKSQSISRRRFCRNGMLLAGAAAVGNLSTLANGLSGRIENAVKVSMIEGEHSVMEKFKIAKEAGFDGISLFAPDRFDSKEALRAQDATGLRIHNVNNAVHWRIRLSDPDPAVREKSLEAMKQTIRFAHQVGASSILQVVGKVTDPERENHRQVWERSIEQIRKAVPLAARLGVRILCENVGNGFCKDAGLWADYLDEIGNPWVGAVFDIGNHQEHGGAPHWVRTLGSRIVKLDVKGHNSETHQNCPIFAGDVDWEGVRTELKKLRFAGWATAEVQGGGVERLREVADRMGRALGTSG